MIANQPDEPSVAGVAEQLMADYHDSVAYAAVTSIVLGARDELAGQVPRAAFPELLHRVADYRLAQIAAGR